MCIHIGHPLAWHIILHWNNFHCELDKNLQNHNQLLGLSKFAFAIDFTVGADDLIQEILTTVACWDPFLKYTKMAFKTVALY